MKNLKTQLRKPAEWGRDASYQHGWQHAYSVAKTYAVDFIGKDNAAPNPHAKYWKEVVAWIEANAPAGELDQQTNPTERGKANESH